MKSQDFRSFSLEVTGLEDFVSLFIGNRFQHYCYNELREEEEEEEEEEKEMMNKKQKKNNMTNNDNKKMQ